MSPLHPIAVQIERVLKGQLYHIHIQCDGLRRACALPCNPVNPWGTSEAAAGTEGRS